MGKLAPGQDRGCSPWSPSHLRVPTRKHNRDGGQESRLESITVVIGQFRRSIIPRKPGGLVFVFIVVWVVLKIGELPDYIGETALVEASTGTIDFCGKCEVG